jgi:DNA-binding XRE family transcriptional regulator
LDRKEYIEKLNEKLKLIRNERGFTQDRMAEVMGISKKTLIQIEKGRASLGWTAAVAVSSIFMDSEILQMTFGGDPREMILTLAFKNYEGNYNSTMGGRVWWRDVQAERGYRIQQNVISKHYRILDDRERRICSTFEFGYIEKRLKELCEAGENNDNRHNAKGRSGQERQISV